MSADVTGSLNARPCTISPCTFWTKHESGICVRCRERGFGQPATLLAPDNHRANFDVSLASRTTTGKQAAARAEKRKNDEPEHREQVALFAKIDGPDGATFPELRQCYAIPNGGKRGMLTARKMKAEGVRAGELDINLDLARGGYFGLRLEMKAPGGALSVDQRTRIEQHHANGLAADVAYGCDDGWRILTRYIQLPPTQVMDTKRGRND
jgi:hypothetical protein